MVNSQNKSITFVKGSKIVKFFINRLWQHRHPSLKCHDTFKKIYEY